MVNNSNLEHKKNIEEMYDRLGRKTFCFWLWLGRLGLYEYAIYAYVFPEGFTDSTEEFSEWVRNCLALKDIQLSLPDSISETEQDLICDLESLSVEYPPFRDIFYIYMRYKHIFDDKNYNNDLN